MENVQTEPEIPVTFDQAFTLCQHYEELAITMMAANNSMLAHMSLCTSLSDDALAILNEWSACVNELNQASAAIIENITGTQPAGAIN